jgi:hypothetical protein
VLLGLVIVVVVWARHGCVAGNRGDGAWADIDVSLPAADWCRISSKR